MNTEFVIDARTIKLKMKRLSQELYDLANQRYRMRDICDHRYPTGASASRPRWDTKPDPTTGKYNILCHVCDLCDAVGVPGLPETPAERVTSTETWRKEREKHEQARQEQARQEQAT